MYAIGGLATETLNSIRTVTALNAQIESINKYRVFLLEAMQIGIRKGFNVGLGNGLLFGACFGTYALGFWYGGKLVADDLDKGCSGDCLTGGTILAVFFSVLLGSMALGQIAPPLTSVTTALTAAVPLFKLINETNAKVAQSSTTEEIKPTEKLTGEIIFSNVTFAYPTRPDQLVCRDYNLAIQKGETVALVGQSGCGKSTIMNLLLKFYRVLEGDVKIDGYHIDQLHTRWFRSQIGYVGQEPVLFSGTIAENIAYGLDKEFTPKLSAEELKEQIMTAAKLANAHEFIMSFPKAYDTDVGSNGTSLSGGQKQRIAIARALIRRPAILLLDEATSALDATSEAMVQESIDMLQQNKAQTTIIIAHRLSTIRNADKIAVIHNGQVCFILFM
jgi:ATP-binding cassette, subfamily B (MDR/TAP), member 1